MRNSFWIFAFLSVGLLSCAQPTAILLSKNTVLVQKRLPAEEPAGVLFGTVENPTGLVHVVNQSPQALLTQLTFTNKGPGTISISQLKINTAGKVIDTSDFALEPGATIYVLFSNNHPVQVSTIEFKVSGSADSITITGLNRSEIVPGPGPGPGGFSSGN